MYLVCVKIPYYPYIKQFHTYEDALRYVETNYIDEETKDNANTLEVKTFWSIAKVVDIKEHGQ